MRLSKIINSVFFLAMFVTSTVVSAAATYPYGGYPYGKKNIELRGDLSYSGLSGVQIRPSIAYRHDLAIQNAITAIRTPSSGYLKTVQFDIQPLPGVEPVDKFKDKSGYHLIPLEEEMIKDLAAKANGNAQWVWEQITKPSPHPIVKKYRLDNVPYVSIGAVFYLSGGGLHTIAKAGGDGVTTPLFETIYHSTPWPSIPILEQNSDGSIRIKALGHSIYDTAITGVITVNGKDTKQLFSKKTGVSNYTVSIEGNFSLSGLPGLKQGDNQVTLKVTDNVGRTATKTITINTEKPAGFSCKPRFLLGSRESQLVQFDLTKVISGPPILGFGGEPIYTITFDTRNCNVWEATTNSPTPPKLGTVIQKNPGTYTMHLHAWKYEFRKSPKGILFINQSTDAKPLTFQIYDKVEKKVVSTHTVAKGKTLDVPLPIKDYTTRYSVRIPTLLEAKGYWAKQTKMFLNNYPQGDEIPDELKPIVKQLMDAYEKDKEKAGK